MRRGVLALVLAPAIAPVPERFVVSADIRPATLSAIAALRSDRIVPPADGRIDGVPVAGFASLVEAVAFVGDAAFADALPFDPIALHLGWAPIPGGGRLEGDDARLHALTIARVVGDDVQRPAWPDHAEAPAGVPVALVVASAPVFAAPAPRLPVAAESHARIDRNADVYAIGHVDRCTAAAPRHCLRWAQVVARLGDRFVFGYVPAFWLAGADAWVPGASRRPSAQLVRSGMLGEAATFVLLARDRDGTLHRKPIRVRAAGEAFPEATLHVDAGIATIVAGDETIVVPLDASLDARPEDL